VLTAYVIVKNHQLLDGYEADAKSVAIPDEKGKADWKP
jgi:hypothetical protein